MQVGIQDSEAEAEADMDDIQRPIAWSLPRGMIPCQLA